MDPYLLVDGLNLAYRCFFAVPELTNSQGITVNALQGWVRALWALEDLLRPQVVMIFFDQGLTIQRRAMLESYKANRPPMPEALRQQLSSIKALSQCMGYHIHSQEGIEADDLIASAAQHYTSSGHAIFIASADKDLAQCISDHVTLLRPSHQPSAPWKVFDPAAVQQHWGVYPEQIIDYLSLIGDTADNIPGIPGVGPKTAQKWLQSFRNIEGIYQNLAYLTPARFATLLPSYRERLQTNQQIIQLHRTLSIPIDAYPTKADGKALSNLLTSLGCAALVAKAHRRYGENPGQLSLGF